MKTLIQKKFRLTKLTKAMITGIMISCTVGVGTPAWAQISGGATLAYQVKQPNTEYTESMVDLDIKVLGGDIKLERTWVNGRWYINPAWANLRLIPDPLDNSIKAIDRVGAIYKRSGDSSLYESGTVYIKHIEEGDKESWRWYDANGNWITYDALGRMTGYGNSNDITVTFIRDDEGRLIEIRDHHGKMVYTFSYDNQERLIAVKDREDRKVSYTWEAERLTKVTDVLGYEWLYGYNTDGQITSRTEPDGGVVKVDYAHSMSAPATAMRSGKEVTNPQTNAVAASGGNSRDAKISRVGKVTEKTGAVTLYQMEYNKGNQQYTITVDDSNGIRTSVLYDANGRRKSASVNGELMERMERDNEFQTKLWNARGLATTVYYDHKKNPIKTIYPDGGMERIEYDQVLNKPVLYINAQGTETALTYNAQGNLIKLIAAQGLPEQTVMKWTYDKLGQPIKITYGKGQEQITVQQSYDENGNVSSITDANGHKYQYTYNKLGLVTAVTNPLGNVWTMEYNQAGYPVSSTNPLNMTVHYTTDALGRITQASDALGRTFNFNYEYSNKGWKVTQTDALNQSTIYQYDFVGKLVSMTSPSGLVTEKEYDDKGRIQMETDVTKNVTKVEYGILGSGIEGLIASTLYPTFQENYKYNTMGLPTQIVQVLSQTESLTTHLSYNELGALVSITDSAGRSMQIEYDALGNRTSMKNSVGEETKQTWDVFGNLISVTDANGNTHHFEYDSNGNQVKEIRPKGETFTNIYDSANQLITQTDAEGKIAQYKYDAAGRLTQMLFTPAGVSQASDVIRYVYNDANDLVEIIQSGTTNTHHLYILDGLGRKTSETITYGIGGNAFTKTLQYAYDEDSRLAKMVYPDGSQQTYTYENGLLKTIQLPNNQQVIWNGYQWTAPTEVIMPGSKQTLIYDALLRTKGLQVNSSTSGELMNRHYLYDKAGNLIERATEDGTYIYGYDTMDRLTQATPPEKIQQSGMPVESFSYDAVGNRLGSAEQPGQWIYNENNQLLQYGDGTNLIVLTYTPNGHLASETQNGQTITYTYDTIDRLVAISKEGTELARYAYDPMGRRISKTVNGHTTYYLYTAEGLVGEFSENGDMQKAYGWMPNAIYGAAPVWQANITGGQLTDAQYNFLYLDLLGTPQIAVNVDGEVTWKGNASAFGMIQPNAQNQIVMNLRFPGQYLDEETGTHYNFLRDYNPRTGRYLQADPVGLFGGMNHYAYVGSNPFKHFDPYGLFSMDPVMGFFYKHLPDSVIDFLTDDKVVNASAGFGDGIMSTMTFGFFNGRNWRRDLHIGNVDTCSSYYRWGAIAGTVTSQIPFLWRSFKKQGLQNWKEALRHPLRYERSQKTVPTEVWIELGLEKLGPLERDAALVAYYGWRIYLLSSGPWIKTLAQGPTPLGGIGLAAILITLGYYGWPNTETGVNENFKNCECK